MQRVLINLSSKEVAMAKFIQKNDCKSRSVVVREAIRYWFLHHNREEAKKKLANEELEKYMNNNKDFTELDSLGDIPEDY